MKYTYIDMCTLSHLCLGVSVWGQLIEDPLLKDAIFVRPSVFYLPRHLKS